MRGLCVWFFSLSSAALCAQAAVIDTRAHTPDLHIRDAGSSDAKPIVDPHFKRAPRAQYDDYVPAPEPYSGQQYGDQADDTPPPPVPEDPYLGEDSGYSQNQYQPQSALHIQSSARRGQQPSTAGYEMYDRPTPVSEDQPQFDVVPTYPVPSSHDPDQNAGEPSNRLDIPPQETEPVALPEPTEPIAPEGQSPPENLPDVEGSVNAGLPTEVVEPLESERPSAPVESVMAPFPAESAFPPVQADPIESTEPIEPIEPTEPTEPIEPTALPEPTESPVSSAASSATKKSTSSETKSSESSSTTTSSSTSESKTTTSSTTTKDPPKTTVAITLGTSTPLKQGGNITPDKMRDELKKQLGACKEDGIPDDFRKAKLCPNDIVIKGVSVLDGGERPRDGDLKIFIDNAYYKDKKVREILLDLAIEGMVSTLNDATKQKKTYMTYTTKNVKRDAIGPGSTPVRTEKQHDFEQYLLPRTELFEVKEVGNEMELGQIILNPEWEASPSDKFSDFMCNTIKDLMMKFIPPMLDKAIGAGKMVAEAGGAPPSAFDCS